VRAGSLGVFLLHVCTTSNFYLVHNPILTAALGTKMCESSVRPRAAARAAKAARMSQYKLACPFGLTILLARLA
jgi:hypothetical protein